MEVVLQDAKLAWPYLANLDLIWDISYVFSQYFYQPTVIPNPPCQGPDRWFYINVVLKRSQVFVPLTPPDTQGTAAA